MILLGFPARFASAAVFDMDAILEVDTLDIEVLQDWHTVAGPVDTRQKLVTINVGNLWEGQEYRVPVRMVVPKNEKAKGFHLTGGSTPSRLRMATKPGHLERKLLKSGVGLVFTVVQEPGSYGQRELATAANRRFLETLDPHYKIQYWAWPATLMRAITTAYAEAEHFEQGKVAVTGSSKNGASPSMAILHDHRMTAVHATVSPIWDSPLRLCETEAWNELETQPGRRGMFSGGNFGPTFNRAALATGHSWAELQKFTADIADDVFISRNLEQLRQRKVDMLFHPGTHDSVAYDIAWGGAHHQDIPIYLGANTGHGKRGHPKREQDQQNKTAFLLKHFFPDQVQGELLLPPVTSHQITNETLKVMVKFPRHSKAESGRIWWMFDRAPDGSPNYLNELIPNENVAEMQYDATARAWTAEIEMKSGISHIDFFSNHRATLRHKGDSYATYLSCPYTRVYLDK